MIFSLPARFPLAVLERGLDEGPLLLQLPQFRGPLFHMDQRLPVGGGPGMKDFLRSQKLLPPLCQKGFPILLNRPRRSPRSVPEVPSAGGSVPPGRTDSWRLCPDFLSPLPAPSPESALLPVSSGSAVPPAPGSPMSVRLSAAPPAPRLPGSCFPPLPFSASTG